MRMQGGATEDAVGCSFWITPRVSVAKPHLLHIFPKPEKEKKIECR